MLEALAEHFFAPASVEYFSQSFYASFASKLSLATETFSVVTGTIKCLIESFESHLLWVEKV